MSINLRELKKDLFRDGQFGDAKVAILREAMFDEEGMTLPKGNLLFEIKDELTSSDKRPASFDDLFAMVLIIFGIGVYELFINKIDPAEQNLDSRPSWLQINSIDSLKSSLGNVILMVLIVSVFEHSLNINFENAWDLLKLAVGVVLIAIALYLTHLSHKGHNNHNQ